MLCGLGMLIEILFEGRIEVPDSNIYQYCRGCGNGLIESAAICPKCGTPADQNYRGGDRQSSKNKSAAVLLAVFLGFWSYLYTFREDAAKFGVSLGGSVLSIVLFVYASIVSQSWFLPEVYYFYIFSNVLLLMTSFTTWLVAVIVSTKRDASFYENY